MKANPRFGLRAGALLLGLVAFTGRAHAGCGDGVLDGGETCDPPGGACVTISGTAGVCSASCACTLPSCGGDCGARCNDVRDQCMRQVDANRQLTKKGCKIAEKSGKQSCDEGRMLGELSCLAYCPGSLEHRLCLETAHDTRAACQSAAKAARDACVLAADSNQEAGRDVCDQAREVCESSCP